MLSSPAAPSPAHQSAAAGANRRRHKPPPPPPVRRRQAPSGPPREPRDHPQVAVDLLHLSPNLALAAGIGRPAPPDPLPCFNPARDPIA